MIREGDILHCHTTLITDSDDLCFVKGRPYEVKFILGDVIEFMNECNYEHRFSIEYRHKDCYRQWFYTREEQLKNLLDG